MWWLGGHVGLVGGPQDFDNGASSKIDDVLAEDGGLLHVLPLAVHLKFFMTDKFGRPFWTILTF